MCMRGRVSLIFSISDGSSSAFFRSILERMFHQLIVSHQLQVSSFLFRAEYPYYQKYVGSSLQHGEFEFRNKSGKFGRDRVRSGEIGIQILYNRARTSLRTDIRSLSKSTEISRRVVRSCLCPESILKVSKRVIIIRIATTNRVRLLSKFSR